MYDTTHSDIRSLGAAGGHAGVRAVGRLAYIERRDIRSEIDGQLFSHGRNRKSPCLATGSLGMLGMEPEALFTLLERKGYKPDGTLKKNGKKNYLSLCKEIEFSLPADLTAAENKELAARYAERIHQITGTPVHWAFHGNDDKGKPNPHVHIIISDYALAMTDKGPAFGKAKVKHPDNQNAAILDAWKMDGGKKTSPGYRAVRDAVTEEANTAMAYKAAQIRVLHHQQRQEMDADTRARVERLENGWSAKTYAERGIQRRATVHVGHGKKAALNREINEAITVQNELDAQLADLKEQKAKQDRKQQRQAQNAPRGAMTGSQPGRKPKPTGQPRPGEKQPSGRLAWILTQAYGDDYQPPEALLQHAEAAWTKGEPPGLKVKLKADAGRLTDTGDSISWQAGTGKEAQAAAVAAMVALGKSKGWPSIHLQGTDEFKEAAAREAARQGLPVGNPELTRFVEDEQRKMREADAIRQAEIARQQAAEREAESARLDAMAADWLKHHHTTNGETIRQQDSAGKWLPALWDANRNRLFAAMQALTPAQAQALTERPALQGKTLLLSAMKTAIEQARKATEPQEQRPPAKEQGRANPTGAGDADVSLTGQEGKDPAAPRIRASGFPVVPKPAAGPIRQHLGEMRDRAMKIAERQTTGRSHRYAAWQTARESGFAIRTATRRVWRGEIVKAAAGLGWDAAATTTKAAFRLSAKSVMSVAVAIDQRRRGRLAQEHLFPGAARVPAEKSAPIRRRAGGLIGATMASLRGHSNNSVLFYRGEILLRGTPDLRTEAGQEMVREAITQAMQAGMQQISVKGLPRDLASALTLAALTQRPPLRVDGARLSVADSERLAEEIKRQREAANGVSGPASEQRQQPQKATEQPKQRPQQEQRQQPQQDTAEREADALYRRFLDGARQQPEAERLAWLDRVAWKMPPAQRDIITARLNGPAAAEWKDAVHVATAALLAPRGKPGTLRATVRDLGEGRRDRFATLLEAAANGMQQGSQYQRQASALATEAWRLVDEANKPAPQAEDRARIITQAAEQAAERQRSSIKGAEVETMRAHTVLVAAVRGSSPADIERAMDATKGSHSVRDMIHYANAFVQQEAQREAMERQQADALAQTLDLTKRPEPAGAERQHDDDEPEHPRAPR